MKLLSFVFAGLLACTSFSATYYCDFSGGSDANNGTATGTPWKHCPGDPTATGTAASATLAAGDTVIFKGGVSYFLTAINASAATSAGIALNWFGSSGNPITYDGNSSGTWGTGRAIVTDGNSTNNLAAFYNAGAVSNLNFRSFYFTQIGGGTLPPDPGGTNYAPNGIAAKPGYGIAANQLDTVLVRDCYFGQLGYYQNLDPIGNNSLAGSAISCSGSDGVTITNCELTQIRQPLAFWPGGNHANVKIVNCFFHDQMEWAITMLHLTNTFRTNVTIASCTFSNTDQYYVGTGSGGQWTGYGEGPHQNAIMMFGAEGGSGSYGLDRAIGDTNVNIFNNYFINTLGYPGGSTGIWLQDGTSGNIYNNVFNGWAANNAVKISGPATNTPLSVLVANNTFYGGGVHLDVEGTAAFSQAWILAASGVKVVVKNNLFSGLGIGNQNDYCWSIQCSTNTINQFTNNIAFDYNFYNSDQLLQAPPFSMVFGIWSQLTEYMTTNTSPSTLGWDNNSVTGNPLFIKAPVYVGNLAANDFHLQRNSPAIGIGTNLSSLNLPGLSSDKDGVARPAGAWDAGAFQFVSPPKAPFHW